MTGRDMDDSTFTRPTAPSGSWEELNPVRVLRAERVETSVTERPTGFGEADFGTMVLQIRYQPDIRPADRVVYFYDNTEPRSYDIKEIQEIGRRRALRLVLHRRPE